MTVLSIEFAKEPEKEDPWASEDIHRLREENAILRRQLEELRMTIIGIEDDHGIDGEL